MKPEFEQYLDLLAVTPPIRSRVQALYDLCSHLCPEELEEIFITEYVNSDGTREYEALNFLSARYIMEAKQFLNNDDVDLDVIGGSVRYWRMKKWDYDWEEPSDKSRMTLFVSLLSGMGAELKASKENCTRLKKLLVDRVVPNIVRQPTLGPSSLDL